MASAFSHAVAALGIGSLVYKPEVPKRIFVAAALCSALPDIDVIGFRFGIHYGDFLGHRGFTHSLFFAAWLATILVFRTTVPAIKRATLWSYIFASTASHGVLDAMTDGGLGVAFFSPFNTDRYFLRWRPIHVAPISVSRFFTGRGVAILENEFVWIWIPSIVFAVVVLFARRQSHNAEA